MFPFVFVLDSSLPFKVKLSALTAPPVILPVVVIAPENPVKADTESPKLTVWLPKVMLELSIC